MIYQRLFARNVLKNFNNFTNFVSKSKGVTTFYDIVKRLPLREQTKMVPYFNRPIHL